MQKKRTTFEIQREAIEWLDAIQESLGEIEPDMESWLEKLEGELSEKATALFYARERCKSMQEEAKGLIDVGRTQKQRWEKQEERVMWLLKILLETQAQINGESKFQEAWGTASIRKSQSLQVPDVEDMPMEYLNVKKVLTIDKTRVKEALKTGKYIQGCKLVERTSATIRSK